MRRLTLKTESLSDLTPAELTDVAGGATRVCLSNQVCPTDQASLCHLCHLVPTDVITVTGRITEQTCTW